MTLLGRLKLRDDRGISLIETVAAVALLMVAIIPMYAFFDGMTQHEADQTRTIQAQGDSHQAADWLVRRLRQAYSGDENDAPIQCQPSGPCLSATAITFLTPDRSTSFHLRKFKYQVDLARGVFETTNVTHPSAGAPQTAASWPSLPASFEPLVDRVVAGSGFKYFDAAGNQTTNRANVKTVEVTIAVDPTGSSRPPGPETYTVTAEIRVNPT